MHSERRYSLLLILILLGSVVHAQQEPAKPNSTPAPKAKTFSGSGHLCSQAQAFEYDGITYQNTIDDTDYDKLPMWMDEKTEPPLTSARVVKIARSYLQSLKLPDEPTILENVMLMRFCEDKWVYSATFSRAGKEKIAQISPTEQRVLGKYFYIYVRPDGSVIKPAPRER